MAKKKSGGQPPPPPVRFAPLGELKVYLVQEHELDQLAAGSPTSLFLNFALTLLPIALTLIVTLATTTIESDRLFQTFVLIAVAALIAGLLLLILWRRTYQSSKTLISQIKNRMPPAEPIAQSAPEGGQGTDRTAAENSPETAPLPPEE